MLILPSCISSPVFHKLLTHFPKNWIISNNIISFSLDPPMLLLPFSQALPKDKNQSRRKLFHKLSKMIPKPTFVQLRLFIPTQENSELTPAEFLRAEWNYMGWPPSPFTLTAQWTNFKLKTRVLSFCKPTFMYEKTKPNFGDKFCK